MYPMIRCFFLCLMMLPFSGKLYSQFDYYAPKEQKVKKERLPSRHFKGEKTFSLSPNIIDTRSHGVSVAGGLKFQIFLTERISLDADLVAGKRYFHGGPGVIALPYWLLMYKQDQVIFDGEGGFTMFLVMIAAGVMSFEHVSYHIPVKNDWEVSPYISLLRFKQYTTANGISDDGGQLSFATGVQADKYFGRFFLSPYIEYNVGYRDGIGGINSGIGFGISFPGAY